MRIAAFMVLKNDVFYLPMALQSVRPYVIGVYVQDQGSTDGSWKFLKDLQAKDGENLIVEQTDTGLERFDKEYNEPYYRTIAVERCEEHFKPDWILKLDADEIYTEDFFRRLFRNDLLVKDAQWNAIRVAGDRFISETHRSVHPTAIEMSPEGIPFVDPHTQLWRAGMGVKYTSNPAFQRFHPILIPDPQPQYWMQGICNIHLHRTFGPKAKAFWAEGTDIIDPSKPLYPPISCPHWFKSAVNMGNSEEVDFTWPDYVLEKWATWEGGVW